MLRRSNTKLLLFVLIVLSIVVSAQQKKQINTRSATVVQSPPDQKKKGPDLTTVAPGIGQTPKSGGQRPEVISMPNLIGKHIKDAQVELQALLNKGGLSNVPITQYQSKQFDQNYRPNAVVRQFPEFKASLYANSEVRLYYNPASPSTSPGSPVMPDLRGQDLKEAEIALEKLVRPLNLQERTQSSTTAKQFEIVNQFPDAGTPLKPNSLVVLYYNPRPPPGRDVNWEILKVLAVGLIGFALAAILKRLRKPKELNKNRPTPIKPAIRFRPRFDPGRQSLRTVEQLCTDFELTLRPRMDAGAQRIETKGNLIASEQEEL